MSSVLGFLLYHFVGFLNTTLRVTIQNDSGEQLFSDKPYIFAIWHQNTFAPFFYYRKRKIAMLVTDDMKGRILGYAAGRLGYNVVTQDRDPARSTVKICHKIQDGRNCLMAVDGPNGPRNTIKEGTRYLTEKTGTPTIAVSVHYSHFFPLSWRWDHYRIPYFFSRVTIRFSKPYTRDLSWDGLTTDLGG